MVYINEPSVLKHVLLQLGKLNRFGKNMSTGVYQASFTENRMKMTPSYNFNQHSSFYFREAIATENIFYKVLTPAFVKKMEEDLEVEGLVSVPPEEGSRKKTPTVTFNIAPEFAIDGNLLFGLLKAKAAMTAINIPSSYEEYFEFEINLAATMGIDDIDGIVDELLKLGYKKAENSMISTLMKLISKNPDSFELNSDMKNEDIWPVTTFIDDEQPKSVNEGIITDFVVNFLMSLDSDETLHIKIIDNPFIEDPYQFDPKFSPKDVGEAVDLRLKDDIDNPSGKNPHIIANDEYDISLLSGDFLVPPARREPSKLSYKRLSANGDLLTVDINQVLKLDTKIDLKVKSSVITASLD